MRTPYITKKSAASYEGNIISISDYHQTEQPAELSQTPTSGRRSSSSSKSKRHKHSLASICLVLDMCASICIVLMTITVVALFLFT